MKYICSKCGNCVEIGIIEFIRKKLYNDKILCERCYKVMEYEDCYKRFHEFTSIERTRCEIGRYKKEIYDWINTNAGEYCVYRQIDESFGTGYIKCVKDGFAYFDGDSEVELPVYELKEIRLIYKDDRKYLQPDESFIIGYKGLMISDGIIGDSKYIYEYNIPYKEKYRDPFKTDYQDVYSHFCTSMEDVLIWRNFISQVAYNKENEKHFTECRLFKVKAEKHYFNNSGAGWVSNCLTVLEEVKPKEIVQYFEEDPVKKSILLRRLKDKHQVSEEVWNKYCEFHIDDFRNIVDEEQALAICVKSSPSYGMSGCLAVINIHKCPECERIQYCFGNSKYKHYCYLSVKLRIISRQSYMDSNEYLHLIDKKCKRELESIERLVSYYLVNNNGE